MANNNYADGKYSILPDGISNKGILYVNHQANNRSGHGGNCLTECVNGDIVGFFSNVSGTIWAGHSVGGWSEYRISSDGGASWSDPIEFAYSKQAWEGDEVYSALVVGVTTAPNGTLIAVVARFADPKWIKQLPPVYLLSYDHGRTWSEPKDLDPSATVEDISLTIDALFVHDNTVCAVFMGGGDNYCPGPYSLYCSEDNGETWSRRSILPFSTENYYCTAGVLDNGDFIVYSYPYRKKETNEYDLHYCISSDKGYTWSEVRTTHFAKKLRNPQLSEKIGGFYFMHGRSGSYGEGRGNLVLYSSRDGINWDEGVILHTSVTAEKDAYSANAVVGKHSPNGERKLLIQSSISYDPNSACVNIHHWWVTNVAK